MVTEQRNIKFRAWDTKDKRMISWQELLDYGSGLAEYFKNPRELIFLEYTGLHDSKGKEIYDGDIVLHPQNKRDRLMVEWDNFYCSFHLKFTVPNPMILGFSSLEPHKLEVIGNIYENPVLTNGK